MIDVEGNIYNEVKIGSQVWTVENLRTTKYNDGTPIPHVTNQTEWAGLSTSAYCWYENNAANKAKYGALYNWYAVNTRKLAPSGWRVPTDADWDTLENYLVSNGYNWDGTTSGDKIGKSLATTTDWNSHTTAGTIGNGLSKNNASGFSALSGGYRNYFGNFYGVGYRGLWWSATGYDVSRAYGRYLYYYYEYLDRFSFYKRWGFSVRLVRDI